MTMRFDFNPEKAVATMAFLVKSLASTEKVKLMKLVFLADRHHFLTRGYPITGDRLCALPYGPVPSATLDMVNGTFPGFDTFRFLHVDDNVVMLRQDPGTKVLSADEIETLKWVLENYAQEGTWEVVDRTHELPEYREAWGIASGRGKRAQAIPYEMILRHSGDESRFRLNRPVASPEMIGRMLCPLNGGEDADL